MCNAKPGARCSGHVKADVDKRRERLRNLTAQPQPDLKQINEEVTALEQLQWDYDATKQGRAELTAKINDPALPTADRNDARNRLARSEQLAEARASSVADMPPRVDGDRTERDRKARHEAAALLEARAFQQVRADLAERAENGPVEKSARKAVDGCNQGVRFLAAQWGWVVPAENAAGDLTPYRQCDTCGRFGGGNHSCAALVDEQVRLAGTGALPEGWEADQQVLDLPDGAADPEDLAAARARRQAALDYMLAHGHTQCVICGQFVSVQVDNHTCPGRQLMTVDVDHLQDTAVDRRAADEERAARPESADEDSVVVDGDEEVAEADPAATTADVEELFADSTEPTPLQQLGALQGYCPRCDEPFDTDTAHLEHNCELSGPVIDRIYSDMDKRERVEAMQEDLQQAVNRMVESGKLAAWLDEMTTNGLNRWSFRNRVLAMLQTQERRSHLTAEELAEFPSDPMVMSAADWKKNYGRHPAGGSKAVWVLAPRMRTITDTDPVTGEEAKRRITTGFYHQPKFDVTQTVGEPLPDTTLSTPQKGQARPGAYTGLKDRVAKAGYTYSEEEIPGCNPETLNGTLGYTDPKSKKVVVDSRLSPADRQSVIAHELAHIHAGHVDDIDEYRQHRGRMETEAEACAYMVNRHLGISASDAESFSPGYIAGWSQGDPTVVTEAMTKATKAYIEITDGDWPDHD